MNEKECFQKFGIYLQDPGYFDFCYDEFQKDLHIFSDQIKKHLPEGEDELIVVLKAKNKVEEKEILFAFEDYLMLGSIQEYLDTTESLGDIKFPHVIGICSNMNEFYFFVLSEDVSYEPSNLSYL